MIVKIDVTQDDLGHGVKRSCRQCPGALAINRHLEKHAVVEVDEDTITIHQYRDNQGRGAYPRISTTFLTPLPLRNFVFAFDMGFAVYPFSFDLNLPESVLRLPPNHT